MRVGQIFFSYSREDAKFALRLGEDLRSKGADIWIDQIDIRPSEPWDEEIEKALAESGCLLVILSHTSVGSENVLNEINYALETRKQVLPILIENDIKKPFNIRRLQHIDFTGSYEQGLELLLKSLQVEVPFQAVEKVRSKKFISLLAVLAVIIVMAVLARFIFKPDVPGSTSQERKSVQSAEPKAPDISNIINGKWATAELTNPFDEFDKYIIYFELEALGSKLIGSINMKSTIEYKNYNITKQFLEGEVTNSSLFFYTVEQSFDGKLTTTFKNFYYGNFTADEIRFTLKSDRPSGFPGQKFIAKRMLE